LKNLIWLFLFFSFGDLAIASSKLYCSLLLWWLSCVDGSITSGDVTWFYESIKILHMVFLSHHSSISKVIICFLPLINISSNHYFQDFMFL